MNKDNAKKEISMTDNVFVNGVDLEALMEDLNYSEICPLCPEEESEIKEGTYLEHINNKHADATTSTLVEKIEDKMYEFLNITRQMCLLKYAYNIIAKKKGKIGNDEAIIMGVKEEANILLEGFNKM